MPQRLQQDRPQSGKQSGGKAHNDGRRHVGHSSVNVPHRQVRDRMDGNQKQLKTCGSQ